MKMKKLLIPCLMVSLLTPSLSSFAMEVEDPFGAHQTPTTPARKCIVPMEEEEREEKPSPAKKSCVEKGGPSVACGFTALLAVLAGGGIAWYVGGFIFHLVRLAFFNAP